MSRLTKFITPVGMCMTNLNSMEHYMPCVHCRCKAEMKIDANGKGYTEKHSYCDACEVKMLFNKLKHYEDLEEQGKLIVMPETGIGDLSDGYHTFNELYHHRAVLFSVICNSFKSLAWKSKKHNDGTMYNGMFIVGIATPKGDATYHYDIEPYWNMFDVKELDKAPEWDGHTPSEAIERISKLAESEEELDKLWEELTKWFCLRMVGEW